MKHILFVILMVAVTTFGCTPSQSASPNSEVSPDVAFVSEAATELGFDETLIDQSESLYVNADKSYVEIKWEVAPPEKLDEEQARVRTADDEKSVDVRGTEGLIGTVDREVVLAWYENGRVFRVEGVGFTFEQIFDVAEAIVEVSIPPISETHQP